MDSLSGLIGIAAILLVAYATSNNRSAINWRLVICGLSLQLLLAVFCLKVPLGREIFHTLGQGIEKLLSFSDAGASFVFGFLVSQPEKLTELFGPGAGFIFAFKLVPTIIFVATLVSIAYHVGLMQRVVKVFAWLVYKIMGASGAEALSNSASIFVGQVEAQLMIKPYVPTMTMSELLAVMAGSMACIAGGIMAVYIQMGVPAEYLLTASLMAIPGALVISKIMLPETEASQTRGEVKLDVEKTSVNLIDAAAHGAGDGLRIGFAVCAMLIAFIALIAMIDFGVAEAGKFLATYTVLDLSFIGLDLNNLSLNVILGTLFSAVAVALGVPVENAQAVGALMGTKMVLNEFVAYMQLVPQMEAFSPKTIAIASFALCGFANFSSIAMQVGGIGEMAPSRKSDLAKLGLRAMFCGTMASYVSAAWAGILTTLPTAETVSQPDFIVSGWPIALMVVCVGVIALANKLLGEKTAVSGGEPVSDS